jgi:putative restriction endonuclease
MLTAAPKEGQTPKYDDEIGAKDGVLRYRYRGSNPDAYDNVAARRAFQLHLPLIYFRGVVPGIYTAIWPAYIIEDDPEQLVFSTVASSSLATQELATTPEFVTLHKAYTERVVKQRLHQDRFRELVVTVYRKRCAVCRLHHPELLDAAHILEDRDERGLPEIPNGLALCKIHHAAYDVNILGISPDFRIEIRDDILEEHDGPMLQHGLKEMDGTRLHLPAKTVHHPKQEYLGIRYERFLAA